MVKTGFMRTSVYPAQEIKKEEKLCDICNGDATGLSACGMCHKDLCVQHQLLVDGIQTQAERSSGYPGWLSETLGPRGSIWCKACLLKAITETF